MSKQANPQREKVVEVGRERGKWLPTVYSMEASVRGDGNVWIIVLAAQAFEGASK